MSRIKATQVKYGAVLSYLLIILNALYGVVMTPFIIRSLGTDQYGVYKTIASLVSSMMVMDFGIGGTVQRYIAKYRAEDQQNRIPNFMAMSLIISFCINVILLITSFVIGILIDNIYANTFSGEQLILAKQLFILLALNALVVVVENIFNGLITGYNRFIFSNGLKLGLLVFRIAMLILLLSKFASAITIVLISIMASAITFIAEIYYIKRKLEVKIKYEYWDKTVLSEAGKYTLLMFLTSVVSQIFSNLDNIIIGAICGPSLVTIYSVGLLFFSMYQNLSSGIAGVMLPTVTNVLSQNDGLAKVSKVIIRAGKAQFILLGAALVGFICIGKDFIHVWIGDGYEDVYTIALILLIPSTFELCINVCHSVLRAQNKLFFRTVVVTVSAVFNAILTVILVKYWSYIGAAIATACSYIICSIVAMNVYYVRIIKLPMIDIYKSILGKTTICLVISGVCLFVFSRFVNGSWTAILADIIVFCVAYGFMLLQYGLDLDEKKQIPIVNKLIR